MQNGDSSPPHLNHAEVHPDGYRRVNRLARLSALQRAETGRRACSGCARSPCHHATEHVWSSAGKPDAIRVRLAATRSVERACEICVRWPGLLFADDFMRRSHVLPEKLPRNEDGWRRRRNSVRGTALRARWLGLEAPLKPLGRSLDEACAIEAIFLAPRSSIPL